MLGVALYTIAILLLIVLALISEVNRLRSENDILEKEALSLFKRWQG